SRRAAQSPHIAPLALPALGRSCGAAPDVRHRSLGPPDGSRRAAQSAHIAPLALPALGRSCGAASDVRHRSLGPPDGSRGGAPGSGSSTIGEHAPWPEAVHA
ncbi:hypothetical protein, partial [Streptacidiphilus pinicola]|uniref:hypothetical protein n=1 Tax=Streptacidiphilus pinicola TaxID=2219663 RepID=UPI001A9E782F